MLALWPSVCLQQPHYLLYLKDSYHAIWFNLGTALVCSGGNGQPAMVCCAGLSPRIGTGLLAQPPATSSPG